MCGSSIIDSVKLIVLVLIYFRALSKVQDVVRSDHASVDGSDMVRPDISKWRYVSRAEITI
jgi:hypothetical protein